MAKCKTCGKQIRVPKGWSIGPAVRRHYWAQHPDLMQQDRGKQPRNDSPGEAVTTKPIKERA